MSGIDPSRIYETIEGHKMTLSVDVDEGLIDDAKQLYGKARHELEGALAQTEEGTKVYNILNQALSDMPKDPKTGEELLSNYNQVLKDLGPLS